MEPTPRFGYTGQAWVPEAGLYYYKARMYSPGLGRFMQADPIGFGAGMNWHAYVGNDPVNAVDPSGLYPCIIEDVPDGAGICADGVNLEDLVAGLYPRFGDITGDRGSGRERLGGRNGSPPQSGNTACKLGKALEMGGKIYGDTATAGAAVGGTIGLLGGPEAALGIAGAFLVHAEYGSIAASTGQAIQDISTGQSAKTTALRFLGGVAGGRIGQSVGRITSSSAGILSKDAQKVLDAAFGKVEETLIKAGVPEIDPDTRC